MSNAEDDDEETGPAPIDPDADKVKIEMSADTVSPHVSLNGTSLEGRERVAIARLEGAFLGSGQVRARLGFQLGETVARSLDALAGQADSLLVESIDLSEGLQMLFAGELDQDAQASMGAESPPARAVEQLISLISMPDLESLSARLKVLDDEILRVLETLMRLIVQAQLDFDLQPAADVRPTRLSSARAGSYLRVLQQERADKDRPATLVGRLDGVIAPDDSEKREFRLTLQDKWERRSKIKGSFDQALTRQMKDLLFSDVIVTAEVSRHHHGERKPKTTFRVVTVRPLAPALALPGLRYDGAS